MINLTTNATTILHDTHITKYQTFAITGNCLCKKIL